VGIKRVAGLACNRLLVRVDNSTGKGTSGLDKFSSKVHRVHMELGGKLLNSLRIETQFLDRLQSASVVDGATQTQKDDVENNRGFLENVADIYVLFLCGVQLVLRSGVLTVLDLDKVDVMGWKKLSTYSASTCEGALPLVPQYPKGYPCLCIPYARWTALIALDA
jgi:hypothetical protein